MNLILCKNYDEMSQKAAELIAKQVNEKPNSVLGLATGSTPIGTYSRLIEMNKNNEIDFKNVVTFNLDEYYPISHSNSQSYHSFMNENLFKYINIDLNNTHIPNGETVEPTTECEEYEKQIEAFGGVDLQILGIGRNGHIGFNEPSESLSSNTHLTGLTQDTLGCILSIVAGESVVISSESNAFIAFIFERPFASKIIFFALNIVAIPIVSACVGT